MRNEPTTAGRAQLAHERDHRNIARHRNIAARAIILTLKEAAEIIHYADAQGGPRRPRSLLDDGIRPAVEVLDFDKVAEAREIMRTFMSLPRASREVIACAVAGLDIDTTARKMRLSRANCEQALHDACDEMENRAEDRRAA